MSALAGIIAGAAARLRSGGGGGDPPVPPDAMWVSPSGSGSAYTEGSPGALSGANALVAAGDTVVMKGGNYSTGIDPGASGSSGSPITYMAAPGEQPVITGGSVAIDLTARSWITIDGINAHGGVLHPNAQFGNICILDDTHNCTLQDCVLEFGNINGIIVRNGSTFNRILNTEVGFVGRLTETNDVGEGIWIRDGNFNLIDGCFLHHGGHGPLRIQPGSTDGSENTDFNILRNTIMDGTWDDVAGQPAGAGNRAGQILNCFGCIVDGCIVKHVGLPPDTATPNAFKIEGEQHIVRRNLAFDAIAVGFSQTIRAPQTPISKNSRVYHNSLWGIGYGGAGGAAFDIDHGTDDTTDLSVSSGNKFKNNAIFDSDAPHVVFRFRGQNTINSCEVANNAFGPSAFDIVIGGSSRANGAFGGAVRGNISETSFDWVGGDNPTTIAGFALQAGSPLIDAGEHLTATTAPGTNSTSVPVVDAKFFFDGYGIAGLLGDEIQIGSEVVRITDVNYTTNTLTIDRAISWSNGAGVSQPYAGSVPDIGAVEFGG